MKTNRRKFIQQLSSIAGASILPFAAKAEAIENNLAKFSNPPQGEEDFWRWVKHSYTESSNIINLNNGGVSPQPKVVQEAFENYNRLANEAPSYYMWRVLDKGREPLRKKLATLAGCSEEELAINRNTTEALETIIFGLPLEKGDEVVVSNFDYPHMRFAWEQREKRDGIVRKIAKLSLPSDNEDELVKAYTDLFTKKTKVVLITHMVHNNGQILPVRKIADAAHSMGISVIVDGAHTFAQLDYKISDLGADYFGTSLHKWLCAPFGTGLLYVKKDKIANLYPNFASDDPYKDDIRKFEHLGTRSFATEQAIGHSIDFHELVGIERKNKRLQYLKNYWVQQVKDIPKVKLFTNPNPKFSCALTTLAVEGKTRQEFTNFLFREYGIHTTIIDREGVVGVRVTPHIYTTTSELDLLVEGIKKFAS